MAFEFVVTVNDVFQMRGGLTQATAFLIGRYGSLDDGINAGARILPEWLLFPPKPSGGSAPPSLAHGPSRHPAQSRIHHSLSMSGTEASLAGAEYGG
ncbi:MAG: hypothetical protein NT159_14035 [Proteobacteria bacterium]|nr:hypothetical protein [Pseudomonadota bacterium]